MNEFDASAYTITVKRIFADGEHCFYSTVAEIPDISSYSDSWEEAYENAIESLEVLFEDAREHGKNFPAPFNSGEQSSFSGRVTLRMSRSMHADVARCAEEDGVSLNQWVVEAISQRRGVSATIAPRPAQTYKFIDSTASIGKFIGVIAGGFGISEAALVLNPSDSHQPYRHVSTAPLDP